MLDSATGAIALAGLEPRALWDQFEALTRIARPSGREELVIEHVQAWASRNGFEFRQDAAQNVVVRIPASAGRESAPVVVLQGHLDMVCERRPDSPYDPAEGRIALVRDGDWLTADGTTLGADNGAGGEHLGAARTARALDDRQRGDRRTGRGRERARPQACQRRHAAESG